ncbi:MULTISPECIES: hypothetical protein [Clostridium]|uniref:hypothetical protein n=1 Tax=Clostridium TaxID=1485 RepID=UPI00232E5F37|nr:MULTISPECIES: hypothetical protein [Clostridium]MDB2101779.1 hypothetical protein [Clostridium paraputrificum]MDU4728267.1 hypothetical protein [Clostridium sp.]
MNNIKLFEGQEVKVKTNEGKTLINLVHTAKCCGITTIAKSRNEVIRWKGKGSLFDKLEKIRATDLTREIQDEITYILDEIENTDDRNSIYMSSWLSKRLALECHSEKANRFKNWLVSLDESRENGQFIQAQVDEEVIKNMNLMAQNMQFMSKAMTGIQQYVQDSIQVKDHQIDKAMELIGLRSRNVSRLTGKLKEVLLKKYGRTVNASDIRYINAKDKIFKEFNVFKWEEIPIGKYNAVFAFIEEMFS